MINNQDNLRLGLYSLFVLTSITILTDFILPGSVIVEEIIDVKKRSNNITMLNETIIFHKGYSQGLITFQLQKILPRK